MANDSTAETVAQVIPLHSQIIGDALLIATNEWMREEIAKAKFQLKKGLEHRFDGLGLMHFEECQKILNRLIRE